MAAIRLIPEIEERLKVLAEKTGRTKSYFMRQAIILYLEKMEKYYDKVIIPKSFYDSEKEDDM
jgi:RHH-type transcriptional regulator, rel operon repressor / antitoxin RelB